MKVHRKLADARRWQHSATYKGRGEFPLDMLRYDTCWPSSGEDVARAASDCRDPRTVTVTRYSTTTADPFTDARWASFGWERVEK